MSQDKTEYFSYLLRLWRENNDDRPVWRASLEDTISGEQLGFVGLEVLFEYLLEKIGSTLDPFDDLKLT